MLTTFQMTSYQWG